MKKKRYYSITFCCSLDEEAAIKKVAADCGLSVSSYCKNVILGHRPKYRLSPSDVSLLQDVRKLTYNLQRISNFFKNGKYYNAVAEVPDIVKKLKSLLYDCNS